MKKLTLIFSVIIASLFVPAQANNHGHSEQKALVILSSGSLQTQGMAMVLSNAMAAKGSEINVLLCDGAGDLALDNDQSNSLKPMDVTPGQLLRRVMSEGAEVNVCALYLPNSGYTEKDLIEGIGVASPPDMASQMLNTNFRVFTF
ncbi:hypothetical protein ACR0ST_10660 [Aliidiomarina sp. Khilg15.8]